MLKSIAVSFVIGTLIVYLGYSFAQFNNYNLFLNVEYKHLNSFAKKQVRCLADNIYYESAFEPEKGKIAVAFVTLNRMNHGNFPDTICDVVEQRTQQVCQFTWFCEKNLTKRNEKVYNDIVNLAIDFYANHSKMKDPTNGALFYHADYVNPQWKNMIRTAVIGRHIFYNRKDLMT